MNKDSFLSALEYRLSELSYRERRDILFDYEEHFNECIKQGMSEEEIIDILDSPEKIAAFYLNINNDDSLPDPNLNIDVVAEIDSPSTEPTEFISNTSPASDDSNNSDSNLKAEETSNFSNTNDTSFSSENLNSEKSSPNSQSASSAVKYANSTGEMLIYSIIAIIINGIFLGFYLGYWGVLIGATVVSLIMIFAGFAFLISTIIATPIAIFVAPPILMQYPALIIALSIISICIGGLLLICMFYIIKFTCIYTAKYLQLLVKWIRGF